MNGTPASLNGHAAPGGSTTARDEPASTAEERSKSTRLRSTGGSSVRIGEEQRARITRAVEQGGGNVQSSTFVGWLGKNTANHATTLDEVLDEDVDDLIRKLEDLAARKKTGG